nr:hemolysin XhlA family protein [Paenibacillus baekrokdamisoli]
MQILNDIAVKVGKLEALQETNAKAISDLTSSVNRLVDRLGQSDDLAREADQRARSAHHRLDKIDKIIFWCGSTVIGGIIVTIVAYGMKGGFTTP